MMSVTELSPVTRVQIYFLSVRVVAPLRGSTTRYLKYRPLARAGENNGGYVLTG